MKLKNYIFTFSLIAVFFSACQSKIKYPEQLPEVSSMQEYNFDTITTKTYMDKDGNIFRIANFDKSNELCYNPAYGACEIITLKDGNNSISTYFDANKQPMISPVYGYARSRMSYTKDSYIQEEAYYDTNNKLMVPKPEGENIYPQKYALRRYEYDGNNNILKMSDYNEKEKVILPITTYEYNSKSQNTKISFVDEKGNLMLNQYKYAYQEYIYDNEITVTEYSYHDTKGNLVMVNEMEGYGADGEGTDVPHAVGKWIYPQEKDTTKDVYFRLYDTQNNLIKEINYGEFGDEEGDSYYDIGEDTFSDKSKMNNTLNCLLNNILKIKSGGNAFEILQGWSYFCYSKQTDYSGYLQGMFESSFWKKDEDGKKLTDEEANSRFTDSAWNLYYISDYFITDPQKAQLAFDKVKPLLKAFISKDLYSKSGTQLLVSTALAAYEDIQKKDATSTLHNINSVMEISSKPDYYQTADLYEPMKKYISMSLPDISAKLSDEQKKEVIVWAYSFWLRRNNDKSTDTAYRLLKEIDEMYQ